MNRKIKIFDYCWHIPHQWDMINALKNDCEFYFGLNVKRHWLISQRPLPQNLNFVTHYEKGKYDIAILHVDQTSVVSSSQKHMIFKHFNETITDVPKIILNHGTPVCEQQIDDINLGLTEKETDMECIRLMREMIGENVMVVNSHAAASEKEWGFGHPVIHGMDPNEWQDLTKEPRVFTALSAYGLSRYYNRECIGETAEELYEKYGHMLHYAKINVNVGKTPEEYKKYLGKSLIYLDTSFRTPMNRARTEAFLSGCCVVQVEGAHDLELWAKGGENIIIVPNNPAEIARVVADLLDNGYDRAVKIGQEGKKMAMREFSRERYRLDWLKLLNRVLNNA